ncbi:MAG: T9SS type A sorting domain-containing protein, partial [Ignavibacteria bacterium]|nr:T9SS type A sorting domain-containing protein [Ignavibacteria bacterium]
YIIKNTLLSGIFFLSFFVSPAASQPSVEWARRYKVHNDSKDVVFYVKTDGFGNCYSAGLSTDSTTGLFISNIVIFKFSPSGEELWQIRTNGFHFSAFTGFLIDAEGSSYISGTGGNMGGTSYTTMKYNSSGTLQWAKEYTGNLNSSNSPNAVFRDGSGNIVVTGNTREGANTDIATVKYSSTGEEMWVRRFSEPGNFYQSGNAVCTDNGGNVYVTGTSTINNQTTELITIKYDPLGQQQWVKRYSGSAGLNAEGNKIITDNLNNIYVIGKSRETGSGYDVCIIKYDPSGNQLWLRIVDIPGSENVYIWEFISDGAGNLIIHGQGGLIGNFLLKYTSTGDNLWIRDVTEDMYHMDMDNKGNIYIAAHDQESAYHILKYTPQGTRQWKVAYPDTVGKDNIIFTLSLDNAGNIFTGGAIGISGTEIECVTVKFSDPTGIQQINEGVPGTFSLSQNYPNPFNPTTTIKFDITEESSVKVVIYDMLGREIYTLVNETMIAGSYKVDFNASDLASGTYFYRINAGDFSDIKKMILIK